MNLSNADRRFGLESDAITWLAVHGNLCLALRHEGNTGAAREMVLGFLESLKEMLVKSNLVTQKEIDEQTRTDPVPAEAAGGPAKKGGPGHCGRCDHGTVKHFAGTGPCDVPGCDCRSYRMTKMDA
jgi:hypothetical protein